MILNRRAFLTGLIAAPVIIRPGILMPIKPLAPPPLFDAIDMVWTSCATKPALKQWVIVFGTDQFGEPLVETIDVGGNDDMIEWRTVTNIVT